MIKNEGLANDKILKENPIKIIKYILAEHQQNNLLIKYNDLGIMSRFVHSKKMLIIDKKYSQFPVMPILLPNILLDLFSCIKSFPSIVTIAVGLLKAVKKLIAIRAIAGKLRQVSFLQIFSVSKGCTIS